MVFSLGDWENIWDAKKITPPRYKPHPLRVLAMNGIEFKGIMLLERYHIGYTIGVFEYRAIKPTVYYSLCFLNSTWKKVHFYVWLVISRH